MKILAFDSSGKATSVAIWSDGEILAQESFVATENHSTTLMPTIDRLVRQAGLTPSELTRVAVAQGPGSYTGLRLAVTAAKTLAFTLGIELVGLSSLQALTFNVSSSSALVIPLINARRGNVYAAAYRENEALLADCYSALVDFLVLLQEKAVTADHLIFTADAECFAVEIKSAFPKAEIITDARKLPSAEGMARLAADLKPVEDIHNFNPIYLKKVEAEERWEAANGAVDKDQELVSRA